MMSTYMVETIVRGYHVYQVVWEAAVGQILPCQRERGNVHDLYDVAIVDRCHRWSYATCHIISLLLISWEKRYHFMQGYWYKALLS